MFISELILENFRGFKSNSISFSEGSNVIIGPNNAGKTSVMKALELLFGDKKNKRLTISDFNKDISVEEFKDSPPKIVITANITESENDATYSDDLTIVSTWLETIRKPYQAKLTYVFFLPKKEESEYKKAIELIDSTNVDEYWAEIESNFIRKYIYKIYGGNPLNENIVEPEKINMFDFQFLTAIRDVERDLFTGRNTLLKEVITFFMDYDLKSDSDMNESEKKSAIEERKKIFSDQSEKLIKILQKRMKDGKEHMLKYAENTGASFESLKPSFEGSISDTELYSALKLIVEDGTGFKLPANQNGLGYNNLIYISLLLAKMQKNASGEYLGSNVKSFSILAIEEPEAHLHPNMQYKFLKFLNEHQENNVRQIFITSHSPNITAAVDLNDIIILNKYENEINISYPGKVFDDSEEDKKSKNYIQRFLDVTKADMFFAKSLILVEGISEQLLVPEFAKIMDNDLTESHVSILNVGGRYFNHFLKLFNTDKSEYAIKKKVACITDLDPVKMKNGESDWVKCSPVEINSDSQYQYNPCSNKIFDEYSRDDNDLIKIYTQKESEGSTFEYELILENPTTTELITDSMRNQEEIRRMMNGFENGENLQFMFDKLRNGQFKENAIVTFGKCALEENKKIKHLIATRYLDSLDKGAVAQDLVYIISKNHQNKCENKEYFNFNTPTYIKEGIEWICRQQ